MDKIALKKDFLESTSENSKKLHTNVTCRAISSRATRSLPFYFLE
jgi:hypothetical protein